MADQYTEGKKNQEGAANENIDLYWCWCCISTNTTEIYASANVEMLREALEKADPELAGEMPLWKDEESLRKLCGL